MLNRYKKKRLKSKSEKEKYRLEVQAFLIKIVQIWLLSKPWPLYIHRKIFILTMLCLFFSGWIKKLYDFKSQDISWKFSAIT